MKGLRRIVASVLAGALAGVALFPGPATAARRGRINAQMLENRTCAECALVRGKTFAVHGRLFAANGTPSLRIWPTGTDRHIGVSESRCDGIPSAWQALTADAPSSTDIYGDFVLRPFTPEKSGEMQFVCLARMRNLVVEHPSREGKTFWSERVPETWSLPCGAEVPELATLALRRAWENGEGDALTGFLQGDGKLRVVLRGDHWALLDNGKVGDAPHAAEENWWYGSEERTIPFPDGAAWEAWRAALLTGTSNEAEAGSIATCDGLSCTLTYGNARHNRLYLVGAGWEARDGKLVLVRITLEPDL